MRRVALLIMSDDDSAAIQELRSEIRYIEVLLGSAEARLTPDSSLEARQTMDFLGDLLRDKLTRLEKLLARWGRHCA